MTSIEMCSYHFSITCSLDIDAQLHRTGLIASGTHAGLVKCVDANREGGNFKLDGKCMNYRMYYRLSQGRTPTEAMSLSGRWSA